MEGAIYETGKIYALGQQNFPMMPNKQQREEIPLVCSCVLCEAVKGRISLGVRWAALHRQRDAASRGDTGLWAGWEDTELLVEALSRVGAMKSVL